MPASFKKALLAAGLAAALVGCGGGSSDTTINPSGGGSMDDPGPELALMQEESIKTARSEFAVALRKVNDQASDSDVMAAQAALKKIKDAIDSATDLSPERIALYNEYYDLDKSSLEKPVASRTAYMTKKENDMKIAARKERNDAAMLWATAITDYSPSTGNSLTADFSGTQDLEVKIENNAPVITLNDGTSGLEIESTSSQAPATGWIARRFTQEADKKRGVIVTNRVPPETKTNVQSFLKFFFDPGTTSGTYTAKAATDAIITGVTTTGTDVEPNALSKTINIGTAATDIMNDNYFSTVPNALDANENRQVSFLGMRGTLTCGATACTTTRLGDDTFHFDNAVTFTPSEGIEGLRVGNPVTDPNNEYLALGYWLTTTGTGSNMKQVIDAYAEGFGYANALDSIASNALVNGAADGLKGTATYSGGAVGVYVLKEGDIVNDPDLHNGEFVANASLTAQFGDISGKVAFADQWKITGAIDNFRSITDSANHNLSKWKLDLTADLGADRGTTTVGVVDTPSLALTNPVTKGGGGDGSWGALFYGTLPVAGSGEPAENTIEAIVGEFDGHFVNGHVAGAFGIEKD